jgi:CelD/BcsL family acetyltransferase involved in cellulose biosynthesis
VGNVALGSVDIPGMLLDVPFTELTTRLDVTRPPWRRWPAGVDVAVVAGQPIDAALPRLSVVSGGVIRYVPIEEPRHYVDLHGSFAVFMKKFSAKSRYNLLRSVRRLGETVDGTLRFQEFRTPEEIPDFLALAWTVSRKTYQADTGLSLNESPAFRDKLIELAAVDGVRGYVLLRDERPLAYAYGRRQAGNLVYDHTGYDPAFSQWSPGSVLLYFILERLFAEQRFRYLDFGSMQYQYKEFFSTGQTRCARLLYLRPTVRSLAIVAAHLATMGISYAGGQVLAALKLKVRFDRRASVLQVRRISGKRAGL